MGRGTPRLTQTRTRNPGRVGGIFIVQDALFSYFGNSDKPNQMSFSTIFIFCAYHSLTYVLCLLNNIYILFHCNLLYMASNNYVHSFIRCGARVGRVGRTADVGHMGESYVMLSAFSLSPCC
jgi:hypothetical protein